MKGHIRERSPGRWAIILDQRDQATGNRKRKWHAFRGTKRQAQDECARLVSEIQRGTYVEPSKITIAEFLDKWLLDIRGRVSPKTFERYDQVCRKNIMPLLGAIALPKLKPMQISQFYAQALQSGQRDGSGGLSARTVHHMHVILKGALAQAVKWDMLQRNPAAAVKPPRVPPGKMNTYDLAQTAVLLEAMRGTRMFVPIMLGVLCGLRRGEIAALRWRSVDIDGASLDIVESAEQTNEGGVRYKEPKGGRARTVALSATVANELRAHRLRRAEELLKLGVRLTDDMFVVARADGQPLQPRSITHEWARLIAARRLPRIRFHDLRHAHATHLLASGVHPKIASERLGHSKVGITMDLYSHVLPGMQEGAAASVDDALRAAQEKLAKKPIG
jgi:integrase